jgi:hypothetical protein
MNWKNALKDELPKNKQEVLISVSGINYVAFYVAELNGFEISEGDGFIPLKKDVTIYWTEISNPKR